MTSELAKTIATCAIWLATAVILTFGLFRMTGSTEFFIFTTLIIAGATAGATVAVWYPRDTAATSSVQSSHADAGLERSTSPSLVREEQGITRKPGL
jgi:hypothetical protein